jgi:hypothetical protein
MKKYIFCIMILIWSVSFSGCASRSMISKENPIKGVSNLYNRNFVVAAPTYAGNIICGIPFLLLSEGITTVYPFEKNDAFTKVINNIYFVPASICGAVIGTPFIPLSYACDESAWDFDFMFIRNMSWDCTKKQTIDITKE